MKKTFLRLLAATMALALMLPMAPAAHAADIGYPATAAVQQSIEQQIRAYAKSIDRSGADEDAAMSLALHGVGSGGKKMTVGASHSLTATILNSELALATLVRGCTRGIRTMNQLGIDRVFDDGGCYWSPDSRTYSTTICTANGSRLYSTGFDNFTGTTNAYDSSLGWMVGSLEVHSQITRGEVTVDTVTYHISVTCEDRFDFNTHNDSIPREIATILGSILFREFDWVATAQFSLTVPNTCTHTLQSSNYHWRYDLQTQEMYSVTGGDWRENQTMKKVWLSSSTAPRNHYELTHPVTLRHDAPWELEYTIRNVGQFIIGPTQAYENSLPYIYANSASLLFFRENDLSLPETSRADDCHGYRWAGFFAYSSQELYTVRLENVIYEDGSNMPHVSVYSHDPQKTLIKPTPMDDDYHLTNGVLTPLNDASSYLSGKDFRINFFNNYTHPFYANYFELKIRENITAEPAACFTTRTVAPTCTDRGYVQHTCTLCGYSYHTDYIAAKGHKFGAYTDNNNATCTTDGTKTAKCSTCGAKDTVSIPGSAKGHQFGAYADDNNTTCTTDGTKTATCAACGVTDTVTIVGSAPGHSFIHQTVPPSASSGGYTRHTCTVCKYYYTDGFTDPLTGTKGDFTGDKKVTDEDAIYLLWHTLFPTNYPLSTSGDLTGDGKVTDEDAVYLLWHTLFPTRYPLGR